MPLSVPLPSRPRLLLALTVALATSAACDDRPIGAEDDRVCGAELTSSSWIHQRPALDLLVVVDRTPSMQDQAVELARFAADLVPVLEQFPRWGVPDLHVAVVTSDLAVSGVAGCGAGDDGRFQGAARCGLDDAYLAVRGLTEGGVRLNGPGTFADAAACLLDVAISTCPVSQPLGAALRALDPARPDHAGFRRDDAGLVVLILTDGDDCTLADPAALAAVTGAGVDDLEAAIDHACFARGTRCTPGDPATLGVHTACTARDDGGLVGVDAAMTALQALHPDPRSVILDVVAGPADPEVVAGPRLAPACGGDAAAGPAPRLATATLPERTVTTSVCDGRWSDAVAELATFLKETLEAPCLDPVIDLDPATPGLQVNCAGRVASYDGATVAPLPWCDGPGGDRARPCLEPLVEDPGLCGPGGGLVRVSPGDDLLPRGSLAELRCEVACE